jgi:putative two-component system response regulator
MTRSAVVGRAGRSVHSQTGLSVALTALEWGHTRRMSRYCESIARLAGESARDCQHIRLATVMHDIGKVGIPAAILMKPGPLTPAECSVMRTHSEIGWRILVGSHDEVLDIAASVALTHHERIDGSGYPAGLRGEEIPVEGRIAAIGDVFDALTSDRVYRRALPVDQALEIMREERSRWFDPDLLDLFVASTDGASYPRMQARTGEPAFC